MNGKICSKCESHISKDKYNNREDIKNRRKKRLSERRLEYPDKLLFIQVKKRAKKEGIPFDLTIEDFKIPEFCPVLGIPILLGQKLIDGKRSDNGPSIDKIDPSNGYVKGNVAIISWRANRLKSDASANELKAISDYIVNRS